MIFREFSRKFRQYGFAGTVKLCIRKLAQELFEFVSPPKRDDFDLTYGTDTSGVISAHSLGLSTTDASHAVRYQTAMADVFPSILHDLPIRFPDFVFVDLGSGKGRALLLASSFPFKAIVGVELAPSLHAVACNNIDIFRARAQQCQDITSKCENAATFEIPNENIAFYLFNPFDEEVMSAVASNIEASLRRFPRSVYILYLKPIHRRVFDASPNLQIFKDAQRYLIYRNKPSSRFDLPSSVGSIATGLDLDEWRVV